MKRFLKAALGAGILIGLAVPVPAHGAFVPLSHFYLAGECPDAACATAAVAYWGGSAVAVPLPNGHFVVFYDLFGDLIALPPDRWDTATFESGSEAYAFFNCHVSADENSKAITRYQGSDKVKWVVAIHSTAPQDDCR